jgi:hypothetical protein
VPDHREDDVILFDPGADDQTGRPIGLNIFDCDRGDPRQMRRVVSTLISTLYKLFYYSWGPRMEDLLRNSIWTLLSYPDEPVTLLDLWLLLASPDHRERYTRHVTDEYQRQFWDVQFAGYAKNARDLIDLVGSSLNKIGRFLADPQMRRIVAQPENRFDIRELMDRRGILLVNLSKGDLGEDNSSLLGSVLVNLILVAALTRRNQAPGERVPFHLYVDEYQSFATESFPTLQSEARKYAIDVTVAHQYRDQLDDLNRGSTLNVANFIVLRTSGIDSHELAGQFDNTPDEPEDVFEPARRERREAQYQGIYERLNFDVKRPGVRRTFSDMQAERANSISGLETLTARCRMVSGKRLVEHEIEIDPLPYREDADKVRRLRAASLALGTPAADVDAFIRERIGDELEFDEADFVDLGRETEY